MCYIPKPVATALYSGLDTCLVIDSGANNTIVTPVLDQTVLSHCIQTKPIGGAFLTNRLTECIRVKGVDFDVRKLQDKYFMFDIKYRVQLNQIISYLNN